MRPAVGPQRDGLGIGDERGDRQREGGVNDLGQSRRDVVETAGVDGHGVTATVDLNPGTVELGFEDGRPAEFLEGVGDIGRGLGEHRAHRSADLERELVECGPAAGKHLRGDRREVPTQHRGPPDLGRANVRGLRDRIGHQTDERALAELAAEQSTQERLFGFGRGGKDRVDQLRPAGLGALAGDRADLGERGVDAAHRQRGFGRRRRQRPQRRPAHPDLTLRQLTGQPRDDDGDERRVRLGRRSPEQLGDAGDLGRARRHGTDVSGRGGDVDEMHVPSLA